MNDEARPDERMVEWLQAGAWTPPVEVLESAVAYARDHPRRARRLAGWRKSPMSGIRLTPVRGQPTSHRTAYLAFVATAAIVVIAVGSVAGIITLRGPGTQPGAAGLGSPSPSLTPWPSPSPSGGPTGTISVEIESIVGAVGQQLFVTVCEGGLCGDGLGGFALTIDSDPFTTTQLVRAGPPSWSPWEEREGRWPEASFGEAVAELAPGVHTLNVTLGVHIVPFGVWNPGSVSPPDAQPMWTFCQMSVVVAAGEETRVVIPRLSTLEEAGRSSLGQCWPSSGP